MQNKKTSIILSDVQMHIIEQIKANYGVSSISTAIGVALAFMKNKIDPSYAGRGAIKAGKTPEERAKEAVELKIAKEAHAKKIHFDKKAHICENILGGEVFIDSGGNDSCRYRVYHADAPDEVQILPLDHVNSSYAEYQFFPDKETVFKKKPELKKKFGKLSK